MSVKFIWKGSLDTDDGIATYSTDTDTFDLWLPSMQRALQIEQVLCTVYADGRRKGYREIMQAATAAINEIKKKL